MLSSVSEYIDYLIEYALNTEDSIRVATSYNLLADNYSIKAELSYDEGKKVVLNTLQTYPSMDLKFTFDDLSETYSKIVTRDCLTYLKHWSYRYGSKGKDSVEVPNFNSGTETEVDKLVTKLNSQILEHEDLNVNDIALALKLTHVIFERYDFEEDGIWDSDVYTQVQAMLEETKSFINSKDPIDWDVLGKTFDMYVHFTQEEIMKRSGKREVLRELREFEGTTVEFLEEWDQIL